MNPNTFQQHYEKYHCRLLNSMLVLVRNPEAAEDITSAAFSRAFEHRHSFRGDSSFYTWLHTIAEREALQRLRKPPTTSIETIEGPLPASMIEPDSLIETLGRSECCQRIRKLLRKLPAKHRKALADQLIRGRSVWQIARSERVPMGTILSRLFTGRQLLRKTWEG